MPLPQYISPEEQQERQDKLSHTRRSSRQIPEESRKKRRSKANRLTPDQRKEYLRDYQRYTDAPWILVFALAVAKDAMDLIPIITLIFDLFTAPYFFYFLWKYAEKKERLACFAVMTLDMFPFIGILPATSFMFFILHVVMRKKYEKAKKHLGY